MSTGGNKKLKQLARNLRKNETKGEVLLCRFYQRQTFLENQGLLFCVLPNM